MADPDPRYPCSSIEDDFNYGSCVASASVHIRMGTSPPAPSGRPAWGCCAVVGLWGRLSASGDNASRAGLAGQRGSPGVQSGSPASSSPPPGPGLLGRAPSPGSWEEVSLPLRQGAQGEHGSREVWWSPGCVTENRNSSPSHFNPFPPPRRKGR